MHPKNSRSNAHGGPVEQPAAPTCQLRTKWNKGGSTLAGGSIRESQANPPITSSISQSQRHIQGLPAADLWVLSQGKCDPFCKAQGKGGLL